MLIVSVGFGIAADETPEVQSAAKAQMEHAAWASLVLFAFLQLCFGLVVLRSGVLKRSLHWAARAGGAVLLSVIGSYVIALATLSSGVPPPVRTLTDGFARWIQSAV